jgi:hypothetical protein
VPGLWRVERGDRTYRGVRLLHCLRLGRVLSMTARDDDRCDTPDCPMCASAAVGRTGEEYHYDFECNRCHVLFSKSGERSIIGGPDPARFRSYARDFFSNR